MTFDGKESGQGRLTAFFDRLLDEVKHFGAQFIVLDTAADLFGGNENIRSQVRQFIANACGRIARETEGAVLVCAHPSLSGMATGFGSSGSTAWNNTVRSRLYLTQAKTEDGEQPDPDLRNLARKKSNYARAGESLTLRWSDGVMVPTAVPAEDNDADIRRRVFDEIDRAWREGQPYSEMPQARTRYVLAHLPKRLGISRSAVERGYLALLGSGEVRSELHDRHRNLRGLRAVKPAGRGAPQ